MRRSALVAPLCLWFAACADPSPPREERPPDSVPIGVPDVAEVVCEADGSTTVRTPQVVVQPDGIHVHVLSHLDEPAQIVGLYGRDVEGGETDYVSTVAPGVVETGCFPYSQHEDPDSLVTSPIDVLDPDGVYVDGEVDCSGTMRGSISDFAEPAMEAGAVPLSEARTKIRGLDDGDEVLRAGYPDQADARVAVRRADEIVAVFTFVTFDGNQWQVEGSEVCESSGIR